MKKLILIVLALGFIGLMSCTKNDDKIILDGHRSVEFRSNNNFTGKDYFVGIFFGINEFGKTIELYEEINNRYEQLSLQDKTFLNSKIQDLLNAIDDTDSTFFIDFKNSILSNDPIQIQTAIGEGAQIVYENVNLIHDGTKEYINNLVEDVDSLAGDSSDSLYYDKAMEIGDQYAYLLSNNMLTNEDDIQAIWGLVICGTYFAFVIHNTVAITANIGVAAAVAVYLGVKFWGPNLDKPSDDTSNPGSGGFAGGGGSWKPTSNYGDKLWMETLIAELIN